MLKLIPYTKQLISIGNQNHYEGQLVWSDGKVAYGWDYAPQQQKQTVNKAPAGFWVGEQGTISAGISWYKLANKALQLSNKISGGSKLNLQCYPCYAQVRDTGGYPPEYGAIYTPNGAYTYNGAIVAMDSDGSLLTYDDYTLNFYGVPSGQRQDTHQLPLYYAYVRLIYNNQLLFDGWVYLSIGKNNGEINQYYIYDLDNVQIAHYYLQNDVWTLDYNGQQYTGDDILEKHYTKPLLSVECTQIFLHQLHSLDYAVFNGIIAIDELRLTVNPTDSRSDLIPQHDRGDDVRKLFQLATTAGCYLTALTPDKDANGNGLFTGSYSISYGSLSGTGYIVEESHYTGDYTITYGSTTLTGSGIIGYDDGGIQIYDNQGNLIGKTNGSNGIIVGAYSGPGTIEVTNVVNVLDGIKVYQLSYDTNNNPIPGAIIAETDNSLTDIIVYDAQGQVIYRGTGTITTNNTAPIRSMKKYHITATSGLQVTQQYPVYWQAGSDIKIDLSNMNLLVTMQIQGVQTVVTVGNDPLNLLTTQGFIFAHGVHAWKNYALSQDNNKLWHINEQQQQSSETYQGIENCFNLAWLKTRWSS